MALSLDEAIRNLSEPIPEKDGFILQHTSVEALSRQQSMPGWQIEARALQLDIIPVRYIRNMDEISKADQVKLLGSSVAQVGLGGLGGHLFEHFLRLGIGRIRAADGDSFEATNLNRQALSILDTIGMPKAVAAANRAEQVNPSLEVDCRNKFLDAQDMFDFIANSDIVIDALGGLTHRKLLQDAAAQADVPLVTGAIAGWTGYVATVYPGHPGPADFMGLDNAAEETLGCPAPAVALVSSIMSAQATSALTGHMVVADTLLVIDLKSLTFEKILL